MKTKNKSKKSATSDFEHYKNECARLQNLVTNCFSVNRVAAAVATKDDQRVYRKVSKNKFLPVNDPYAYDGLRNGFWLVHVKDGSTSIRQQVWPDRAVQTAAARLAEDEIVEIIRQASVARPSSVPLTPAEKADWDALIKKHGARFSTLQYPSFQENAEKIVKALLDQ